MPASRRDLMARLANLGIRTETREHAPVFTVAEAQRLRGEIPGAHTKNLFLKDEKGALYLIVCLEDARIDLKAIPGVIGSRRLSFGKPDLLTEVLGVEAGSVTPFALVNAAPGRLEVILDTAMLAEESLNFHPLKNDATTTIAAPDLVTFIRSCGHEPKILPLSEPQLQSAERSAI
jgi:Ala-tRNA(Pro) deacylase